MSEKLSFIIRSFCDLVKGRLISVSYIYITFTLVLCSVGTNLSRLRLAFTGSSVGASAFSACNFFLRPKIRPFSSESVFFFIPY